MHSCRGALFAVINNLVNAKAGRNRCQLLVGLLGDGEESRGLQEAAMTK
jgi:hypothetical protein